MFLAFQWDIMLLEVGFLAIFFHSNFNDDYEDEINVFSLFYSLSPTLEPLN